MISEYTKNIRINIYKKIPDKPKYPMETLFVFKFVNFNNKYPYPIIDNDIIKKEIKKINIISKFYFFIF